MQWPIDVHVFYSVISTYSWFIAGSKIFLSKTHVIDSQKSFNPAKALLLAFQHSRWQAQSPYPIVTRQLNASTQKMKL